MKIVKTILVKNRLVNLIVKPQQIAEKGISNKFCGKILDNSSEGPYNSFVNAIDYGP